MKNKRFIGIYSTLSWRKQTLCLLRSKNFCSLPSVILLKKKSLCCKLTNNHSSPGRFVHWKQTRVFQPALRINVEITLTLQSTPSVFFKGYSQTLEHHKHRPTHLRYNQAELVGNSTAQNTVHAEEKID